MQNAACAAGRAAGLAVRAGLVLKASAMRRCAAAAHY
jgi:hypothetical protein